MTTGVKQIFISYRQDDVGPVVAKLRPFLEERFGVDGFFVDYLSLQGSDDLLNEITRAIQGCHVLLPIIGPGWEGARTPKGALRLDNPRDYVRWEIATALTANLHVMPVLVNGTRMPAPEDMPLDIALLSRLLAIPLRDEQFDTDARRLIDGVDDLLHRPRTERRRIDPDLIGNWSYSANLESIINYDFYPNGTYECVTAVQQTRPTGTFVYQWLHQGAVQTNGDALILEQFLSTTTRRDQGSPDQDYVDRPRQVETIRLQYQLSQRKLTITDQNGATTVLNQTW